MSVALSPDTGEVLRAFFGAQGAVTAITGTRIAVDLTGLLPAIRYALLGGGDLGGGAVYARYQVECWGAGGTPDDGTSDLLGRTILSVIPNFSGSIGGATVSGASATYPVRQDDPQTNRPRNILEVVFTATP